MELKLIQIKNNGGAKIMRRKIPEVREDLSEIKTLLKKESKSWKKQRIQMLYLLKSKQVNTIMELSSILAVNRNTVGRWLAMYEKGNIENLMEMKRPRGRTLSIPLSILVQLKEKLKTLDYFKTYKEIQSWLKNEYKLEIPYKTVHKIVKYKLKSKPKVSRKPVNKQSKVPLNIS